MKVALIIRGESRHYKEGHALLKHMLFNKYPDIDFRIFSAISPTITKDKTQRTDYSSNDDYSECSPVYSTEKLDKDTLSDIVNTYLPGRFLIVTNKIIIDLMDQIIETYSDKIFSKENVFTKFNDTISRIDIICKWFYFFSQHINYLAARQCLINYSVENDWVPDMIITTRIDLFFNFDINFFNKWNIHISECQKRFASDLNDNNNTGFVFPRTLVKKDKNLWIDDWLFIEFYNKKIYEYYNRPLSDIFLDYLARDTSWTEFMFDGNSSHYMWSIIFSDMLMCSYPTISELNYFAGILRPCSNFDLIKEIINTDQYNGNIDQLLFDLAQSQKNWKNGSNGKRPSDNIVIDTFKLLSTT